MKYNEPNDETQNEQFDSYNNEQYDWISFLTNEELEKHTHATVLKIRELYLHTLVRKYKESNKGYNLIAELIELNEVLTFMAEDFKDRAKTAEGELQEIWNYLIANSEEVTSDSEPTLSDEETKSLDSVVKMFED